MFLAYFLVLSASCAGIICYQYIYFDPPIDSPKSYKVDEQGLFVRVKFSTNNRLTSVRVFELDLTSESNSNIIILLQKVNFGSNTDGKPCGQARSSIRINDETVCGTWEITSEDDLVDESGGSNPKQNVFVTSKNKASVFFHKEDHEETDIGLDLIVTTFQTVKVFENCSDDKFLCSMNSDQRCISNKFVCDGYFNCGFLHSQDEDSCGLRSGSIIGIVIGIIIAVVIIAGILIFVFVYRKNHKAGHRPVQQVELESRTV